MQLVIKPKKYNRAEGFRSGRRIAKNRLLQIVVKKSEWQPSRIAKSVVFDFDDNNSIKKYCRQFCRKNFQKVLSGKRNTKHYIIALEKCWLLPISKIREIYKQDLEREPTHAERSEFVDYYESVINNAKKNGTYLHPRRAITIEV